MIRRFLLRRLRDATGISGTGIIAEGILFSDGTCVLRWTTKLRSTAVYESIDSLEAIHGHGGDTVVEWFDVIASRDRPEEACQRCGRRNPTWFAPSDLWNAVMRPKGEASEEWSIVCPSCFAELAEATTVKPSAWQFAPEVRG